MNFAAQLPQPIRTLLDRYVQRGMGRVPQGSLDSFGRRGVPWATLLLLIVAAVVYFRAAQHWLLFAAQLWLGYAGAWLALAWLQRRKGSEADGLSILIHLLCGALAGGLAAAALWYMTSRGADPAILTRVLTREGVITFGFGIIVCGIAIIQSYAAAQRASARAATEQLQRQQELALRQETESRLRMLQAQIEPHFLLNTLANVRSLMKRDADRARDMLDHLSDYLQIALPRMREEKSTLEREAQLSSSYLAIMQIRMGGRLSYRVNIEPAASSLPLAPMLLQTLVENAVKHGAEPSAEACEIVISAAIVQRIETRCLQLSVADTGVGFGAANTRGTGVGLANVRERLNTLYGAGAELMIEPNTPQGVRATLAIPLH